MTYIIGDVHGNFNTLLELKSYLSQDSKLVFVGDLIDRGKYSKDVIKFVRDNKYLCTLGNHEKMMIEYAQVFLDNLPIVPINHIHSWLNNGGKETLLSYDLININNEQILFNENSAFLNDFKEDLKWLKTLPLYIEINEKINDRKVVVSHSCISNVWNKKDELDFEDEFEEYALWYRDDAKLDNDIFNIFGHTPMFFGVDLKEHYINLDTGCYIKDDDYGKLSTFCIQTQEVISINRNKED